MNTRIHDESGKFTQKSEEVRQVRSLRLTDSTWALMGQAAESRSMTRADLLESMTWNAYLTPDSQPEQDDRKPLDVAALIQEWGEVVLGDRTLTRQGKDKAAIRRAIAALVELAHQSNPG